MCVYSGVTDLGKNHWLPLAEQAVNTIYRLAEHPDQICGGILKILASKLLLAKQNADKPREPDQEG